MDNKPKKRKGGFLITLGLLTIIAALGLVGYNVWDAKRAEDASKEIVDQLDAILPAERTLPEEPMIEEAPTREEEAQEEEKKYPPMPVVEIDGYYYIGELDIPDLGLHLPVMSEWDMDRLKISPCHYSGSYYSNDLVVLAHNYARHFSLIKWIDIGEDVYLTTVDGMTIHYTVTNRETLEPTDIEAFISNIHNSATSKMDWDMTLFTCNIGGQTRCAVRCSRVE